MMGAGWPLPPPTGVPDPTLTSSLPPVIVLSSPPATWPDREEEVARVLGYLTPGQKAKLYRTLHEGEGLRLDRCRAIEEKERREIAKPEQKRTW